MIIDPRTGAVVQAKAFDTYLGSDALLDFIAEDIPEDTIVAAACKDDCTKALATDARQWFADMGS